MRNKLASQALTWQSDTTIVLAEAELTPSHTRPATPGQHSLGKAFGEFLGAEGVSFPTRSYSQAFPRWTLPFPQRLVLGDEGCVEVAWTSALGGLAGVGRGGGRLWFLG